MFIASVAWSFDRGRDELRLFPLSRPCWLVAKTNLSEPA